MQLDSHRRQISITMPCRWSRRCQAAAIADVSSTNKEIEHWRHIRRYNLRQMRKQARDHRPLHEFDGSYPSWPRPDGLRRQRWLSGTQARMTLAYVQAFTVRETQADCCRLHTPLATS